MRPSLIELVLFAKVNDHVSSFLEGVVEVDEVSHEAGDRVEDNLLSQWLRNPQLILALLLLAPKEGFRNLLPK
jgi:hypothetical protein